MKMKCPRCGLAELNSSECPICHFEVKSKSICRLREKLEGHWNKDHALRALWQFNLDIYARTKGIMLMISVFVIIAFLTLIIETVGNLLVAGFGAWFALMAIYDFYKTHEAKKR